MGTKRKRGQTKQNKSSTNSRKQKKKRKTRRKGFKQAKLTNEVDSLHIEPSTSTDCKLSTPATRERSESSCCAITCASADESVQRSSLWRIGVILNRLKNLASFCQHSTVDWCFSSIRSVYLILNWLKQTFGFGIQTLGKFLLGDKDYPVLLDRKTQLDMMVRRMEALEEEVNQMKSELAKKTTCPCGDHCNGSISRVGSVPVPKGLPPPPPPPPPPVQPPPAPPLAFLKNKQPVSKPITSQENKSTVSRTLVTLEDLKKVKLKKVKQADEKDKENTEPESKKIGFKLNKSDKQNDKHCLVTLRDLKSVRLKKIKEDDSLEKIRLRTPEEMVVMRRSLRKVNISRSPGGTPVVSDKALEHGTGLTPMMTRALRKKFQHAHPYSSPDSPSKRQSLSPMTIRSPKAQKVLSPLSFR